MATCRSNKTKDYLCFLFVVTKSVPIHVLSHVVAGYLAVEKTVLIGCSSNA